MAAASSAPSGPSAAPALRPANAGAANVDRLPMAGRTLDDLVHGQARYKFASRPNVAVVEAGLATVRLDPHYPASLTLPPKDPKAALQAEKERMQQLKAQAMEDGIEFHPDGTRSIAIQTAYRDSAAQTAPYTPDFVLPPGTTKAPEVLHLANLTAGGPPGQSLPPGKAEVEAIDLARKKARIEASLPPLTDECSFEPARGTWTQRQKTD
jgi:Cilia- and flagella-associated protein 91